MSRPTSLRGVRSLHPSHPITARGEHWAVFASGLVLLLAALALDFQGFLRDGGPLRYGVMLVLLGPVVVYLECDRRRYVRRARPADALLAVLLVYGLAGSIAGKASGVDSSYLPVFVAMSMSFIHIPVRSLPTAAQAQRMLWWLMVVSSLYLALHTASAMMIAGDLLSEWSYHHEKAFFIPLAVAAAAYLRHRLVMVTVVVLTTAIVVQNPAATYVVVAVAVIGTLAITDRRVSPRGTALICVVALLCGAVLYLNVEQATQTASAYFEAVGKSDNTPVRQALIEQARRELATDPLLGDAFLGELASQATLSGQLSYVPAHNDYLEMATGGGLVALGLLLIWIVAANWDIVGRYHRLLEGGHRPQAQLLRTLHLAFNTFLLMAAVNPLLSQVGLGMALFSMYAVMRTIEAGTPLEARL